MRASEPGLRTTGLHQLDKQSLPSRFTVGFHSRELQDQAFSFCRRFGTVCLHLLNSLQHTLDRFSAACDRAWMKINAKNTEVLFVSTNPSWCTRQVSGNTLQQVENFKYPIFKSVFVPILTCGHESWVMTERKIISGASAKVGICEKSTVWQRVVPRLDCARGKKKVWRLHIWT